ncbi:MAG: hypothetical protein IT243_03315 [Bacteroidia bacterium]|nr:hypothetical protein [Bacteroidia bacterium]
MKIEKGKAQISPAKIFGALILLNVLLALIIFIFPTGNIKLLNNYTLKFVSLNKIFDKEEKVVVDAKKVIADIKTVDTSLVSLDTKKLGKNKFEEIIVSAEKKIQYPANNKSALTAFFKSLAELESLNSLIRIIHYGDSQLEGDRISDYLRNRLQLRFGGWGPGIVLPYDISNSRISVKQSESKNWVKYAIYGKTAKIKNGFYGIGASSYRYTTETLTNTQVNTELKIIKKYASKKIENPDGTFEYITDSAVVLYDTIRSTNSDKIDAWFDISNAISSFPRVRQYNKITLLYSADNSFKFNLKSKNGFNKNEILPKSYVECKSWEIGENNKGATLNFTGESPYFYGVALDGSSGVAVDNFPMRGSSALGFDNINRKLLNELFLRMNVKLIILQYGINLVPDPKNNYNWYENAFSKQLSVLKSAAPFASILVIGPSDMSMKTAEGYESYPNITLIRDAMKNAAFENGCAFWDLYAAMGGKNSMSSWVENNLAAKDFTHFSTKGARYVSEMLYNAIIDEYQKFLKTPN